jgi:UDP-N-acetyl-D-mannosaminuronic acid dehydrogenase
MKDQQSSAPLEKKGDTVPFKKIAVVGLGYIGLPTAAMFASRQVEVIGVDVNTDVVDRVNNGEIHIVEPDLDIVVRAVVTEGFLRASATPEKAEAFLVAVPTPFKGDNREPDLSYVEAACRTIAPVLEKGNLVVLASTSPVGTTEKMAQWLAEFRPDLTFPQADGDASDIRVAHCPERVLPGKVMQELISNDRVIGGMTEKCSARAVQLYKTFVAGGCVTTTVRAAEMAKLTENSFRDTNIAFANELSLICDKLGVDVWEVIALANRHPRVEVLRPGPGVGGHCIAVDPWFIVASAPEESRLIRVAREVNNSKPNWVLRKLKEAVTAFLKQYPKLATEDVTIACYGLAFKPDIDDLRESPALQILQSLARNHDGPLLAVEPNIPTLPSNLGRTELVTLSEAFQRADVHIYLVAHREFKKLPKPPRFVIDTVGI